MGWGNINKEDSDGGTHGDPQVFQNLTVAGIWSRGNSGFSGGKKGGVVLGIIRFIKERVSITRSYCIMHLGSLGKAKEDDTDLTEMRKTARISLQHFLSKGIFNMISCDGQP